jgi:hypothetical protein
MYLAEAKADVSERVQELRAPPLPPSARWKDFPFSRLSHHGDACCEIAREWVLAMDFAQLNGGDLSSGPRWIRARYKWGPSSWPMHWCQVVDRKIIDCGAHAALASAVFESRGLSAFPTQLVQRYSEDATEQWRRQWVEEQVSCHWLDSELIYHEATALLVGQDRIKIWDGSAACWVDPRQSAAGYGSVAAVRIFADADALPNGFVWGERRLHANSWIELGG